jgi:hypothetical protein
VAHAPHSVGPSVWGLWHTCPDRRGLWHTRPKWGARAQPTSVLTALVRLAMAFFASAKNMLVLGL